MLVRVFSLPQFRVPIFRFPANFQPLFFQESNRLMSNSEITSAHKCLVKDVGAFTEHVNSTWSENAPAPDPRDRLAAPLGGHDELLALDSLIARQIDACTTDEANRILLDRDYVSKLLLSSIELYVFV